MRQNDAGCYLLFSVLSEDDRRYFIIIPEGFDLLGWDLFRSKLKELARIGDGSKYEAEDSGTYGGGNETSLVRPDLSYVDAIKRKAKGRSEEVWVEVGNEAYTSTLKELRHCLVGRWNIENEAAHDLRVVEIWANTHWSFSGQVSVSSLSDSLFLFEFSKVGDAQKVLEEGSRCLNGVRLSLDWWAPIVGCSRREFQRDVSWVRIPGLPLQFWSMEFFKMVGDACGGFVDVDEETKKSSYRKGARILVKNNGKEVPGSLEVIVGFASFSIPLWWEDSVWFLALQVANRLKIQREGEPESRASIQQEEGGCESRKVVRVKGIRYGEGNSEAAVGDRVSGWGLRIPEEKASRIGCEGLGSLQEEAGLVKETLDMTGNGSAEVVRRDGKLIFGGGRKLVDGLGGQMSKWAELGGPSGMRSPVAIGPNFLLKERAWAYPKRRGNGLVIVRPNNFKGLKNGLAHASILGLLASKSGELKMEFQKPCFAGESSEKEAPPLDQGRRESPLESHSLGMFPRSIAFRGVSEESYGLSSPSISGMGVSVEYPLAWQLEETCEDPLEAEVPLRMILKDGRSFTLPEGVTPRSRGNEVQTLPLHITVAGEGEKVKSP